MQHPERADSLQECLHRTTETTTWTVSRDAAHRCCGLLLYSGTAVTSSASVVALGIAINPAHHVGWNSVVDPLWLGEVEAGHDGDKLFHRLGQARVVLLLLAHCAAVPTLIGETRNFARMYCTY